jgi:putative molybdopterin biosynthesis protein
MAGHKFLHRVSLETAREAAIGCTRLSEVEQIPVESAAGRITADPVFAPLPSPHYRASAMDGIAVRSDDLASASGQSPVILLPIAADAIPAADGPLVFAAVDTGSPLPEWADAVVRIENTKPDGDGFAVSEALPAGRDVRPIGEDIQAGALLFGPGHTIRPYDIGAMLAGGVRTLAVRRRPRVAMLATGTEVIEPGEQRTAGKVVEYNSRVMGAYITEWGGEPVYLGRVPDDRDELKQAIVGAAQDHDVVAVIAGSSLGRKDFTVDVIAESGDLLVHGVDMMPGKPASVASIEGTPVIGIPGYPISAIVTYQQLLAPVIATALGIAPPCAQTLSAEVRRKIPSRLGVEEFLRVSVARDADGYVVAPLPRGAGSITTIVRADAILRIGANSEGVDAGSRVSLELLRPSHELEHSIVTASSPDAFAATLETLSRSTLPGLRLGHITMSPFDSVVAMERGEVELSILAVADKEAERELLSMLRDRLGDCTAYRVRAKGSEGRRVIIIGRALGDRTAGQCVSSVLGSNTFALELATVEGFETGVTIKRVAPA